MGNKRHDQEHHRVGQGRNGNRQQKKDYWTTGEQENICKDDPADPAGRAKRTIFVVSVNYQRQQRPTDDGRTIDQQQRRPAKHGLDGHCEAEKTERIEKKMPPIRVDQSGRQHPFELLFGKDRPGIKHQPIFQPRPKKCGNRDRRREEQDDDRGQSREGRSCFDRRGVVHRAKMRGV